MTSPQRSLARWFKSNSNRVFIVWPLAFAALFAALGGTWADLNLWGLPLMAWGYAQYRLVGNLRNAQGGGGPGLSNPPERLVTTGPYGWTRNPMYLGHLIFFTGVGLALGGPAWALLVGHAVWYDRRVRGDEAHLQALFGDDYRAYMARVKRWIPGIY